MDDLKKELASLRLDGDADTVTRHLPYGKQRLLEIALALMTILTDLMTSVATATAIYYCVSPFVSQEVDRKRLQSV